MDSHKVLLTILAMSDLTSRCWRRFTCRTAALADIVSLLWFQPETTLCLPAPRHTDQTGHCNHSRRDQASHRQQLQPQHTLAVCHMPWTACQCHLCSLDLDHSRHVAFHTRLPVKDSDLSMVTERRRLPSWSPNLCCPNQSHSNSWDSQ